MANFLRLVGTLAAIALVASFGLSAVYNATYEITEEIKRLEQETARSEALGCAPDAVFVETRTDSLVGGQPFSFHTAYEDDSMDDVVGYAFTAYGKGYSSTIETIVGVEPDGGICATETIFQKETPGLGAKIIEVASKNTLWDVLGGNAVDETGVEPWFEEQFNGLDATGLYVVKTESDAGILAITGATISSDAVTNSVRDGLTMLVSIVGTVAGDGAPPAGDAELPGAGETEGDGAAGAQDGQAPRQDAGEVGR